MDSIEKYRLAFAVANAKRKVGDGEVDLSERKEILDAKISNLEGRLLAVKTERDVIAHAARLEARGYELIAKAAQVRANVERDRDIAEHLKGDLVGAKIERKVVERLLRAKVRKENAGLIVVLMELLGKIENEV